MDGNRSAFNGQMSSVHIHAFRAVLQTSEILARKFPGPERRPPCRHSAIAFACAINLIPYISWLLFGTHHIVPVVCSASSEEHMMPEMRENSREAANSKPMHLNMIPQAKT